MQRIKMVPTLLILAFIFLTVRGFAAEIHQAASEGDLESIKKILQADPQLLEATNQRNETPLIAAANAGNKEVVLFLLEKGAKIDHMDSSRRPAIFHPSYIGNDEIVEILLDHGADPTLKDVRGNTSLYWAAVRGHRSTVDLYSRKGFEVTLHEAAACGHIELMEKDLAKGYPLNGQDDNGNTPSHLAILGNQQEALELLLERGADLDIKDKNELTPFDLAVERKQEEIIAFLKSKGYEQTPVADPDIVRLADGIHQITFPFYMKTNIVAQTGPDGIILVDTGFSRRAVIRLKEEIAVLRDGDINYIINTHEHWDHVTGNFIAGEATRTISFSVIDEIEADGIIAKVDKAITEKPGTGFEYYYSMRFNGEEIRMIPCPGIHSENDMLIHFTGSNVVHMGDLLLSQSFPAIGDVPRYLEFLDLVIEAFPEETIFVSGHGRGSTLGDVRNYRKMLQKTSDMVRMEMTSGKTLEEIRAEKILEDYESWGEFLTFLNTDSWSRSIFRSYSE